MSEDKAKKDYKKLEQKVEAIIAKEGKFTYEQKIFQVKKIGKPTVARTVGGEPKTDLYILASSNTKDEEFKISIKQTNYDFVENKIKDYRAEQIWGENYKQIIMSATKSIIDRFETEELYILSKNAYAMGWKVEITNKERHLSVPLKLSEKHLKECIYMGGNLSQEIRNASVNNEVIQNSGVAEYILTTTLEELDNMNATEIIQRCIPISTLNLEQHYIVFTRNSFVAHVELDPTKNEADSTDGKRSLGVIVDWSISNGKLKADIDFDKPFQYTGYDKKGILIEALRSINKYPYDLVEDDFEDPSIFNDKPSKKKRVENNQDIMQIESINDHLVEEVQLRQDKYNVISLLCGAGGLDLGVELAGLEAVIGKEHALEVFKDRSMYNASRQKSVFNNVYSNDFSKEALYTLRTNFPKHVYLDNGDIRNISEFPAADLVLGKLIPQSFSVAKSKLVDDGKNDINTYFTGCLIQTRPRFFIAETVSGMSKNGVLSQLTNDFDAAGYRVYTKLVNACDYGIPQSRIRVFVVGVRNDLDFEYEFPEPTHGDGRQPYVTLKDAIGDLEGNPGEYYKGAYSKQYMSKNRKKRWEDQSFTIPVISPQIPLHPGGMPLKCVEKGEWIFPDGEENHRRLSVREVARIQTFPDWYEFSDGGNRSTSVNGRLNKIYKQIGNEVPVLLARAIAKPIADYALKNPIN